MAFSYQCLSPLGQDGMLCAARSSSIFVFGADGLFLSSWQHPAVRGKADRGAGGDGSQELERSQQQTGESSPAPKRRKVDSEPELDVGPADPTGDTTMPANLKTDSNGQKHIKRGRAKFSDIRAQEYPIVNILKATPNGNHVVAVTGQDKIIWVLEHDGQGQLKELSQRTMPKRPSDLALTLDSKTLLVADKFGDVYSLPLIPSTTPQVGAGNGTSSTVAAPKIAERVVTKGANILTVHSLRNVKALEDQRRQRESGQEHERKEAPTFEHELLLGHVSMLTSIAAASSGGKPYILTGDRDEHIRVSRGIPQAYVIENYCLGHTAFINALCLSHPDTLVSGGGDNELYVWDWRAGTRKAKIDLLSHVQEVVSGANKLAVSKLYSCGDGVVVVICERVPAIFTFKVGSGGPEFSQTLQLRGNPLDLALLQVAGKPTRLVVGIDANSTDNTPSPSLESFHMKEGNWVRASDISFQQADVDGPDVTRAELDKLLYTVEYLRKTDREDHAEEMETPAPDSEADFIAP